MKRNWLIGGLVLAFLSVPGTTPAVAEGLIGDNIGAVLIGGYSTEVTAPFGESQVQVVDPGVEFAGALSSTGWADDDYPLNYSVEVDVGSDYFTVTVAATNDWGWIAAIGVGEPAAMYEIQISDLDLPAGIVSVVYDPSRSTGWQTADDIRELAWDSEQKQVVLRFAWVRDSATYVFALQSEDTREEAAVDALVECTETIIALDPSSLSNEKLANALANKIGASIELIEQGLFGEAHHKLQKDVLSKTDGYAQSGSPDRNDWILTCEGQAEVYPLVLEAIALLEGLL